MRNASRENAGILSTVSRPPRRCAKFAALEERRRLAGVPYGRICAAAGVAERAYRGWLRGIVHPRPSSLRALDRALRQLGREAVHDAAAARLALYRALVAMVAADRGMCGAEVLAADPHANAKGDAAWMRAAEVRHQAIYLLVTVHNTRMSAAAACAGISKQAVSKILRAVEDDRDNVELDRRLDALAAPFEV